MTSTTSQNFITREEFLIYKKAVYEESLQFYKRIDALTEAMLAGFNRMDKRFEVHDQKFEDLTTIMLENFDRVHEHFAEQDKKFIQIDEKFLQIDERFIQIDEKFVQIDERFDILTETMLDGFDRIYDKQIC